MYRLLVLSLLLSTELSFGQHIKGKVYDASNQQGLAQVLITYGGQQQVTDLQGNFQVVFKPGTDTLFVSHLGYEPKSVLVDAASRNLNILLTAQAYKLSQVVVQGTNSYQSLLNVPASISLISKKEIDRETKVNFAEVLNRVPGVFMHNGTLSTNRITIRGIGSRSLFSTAKIRAYLNEIPLTTGEGETTLEDIDLSLIDRIEVIKGPAASIYGAGLGGTINLKVAKAHYQEKSVSTELNVGSYGLLRNITQAQIGTDQINVRLNYNRTHLDGYRDNSEYDRESFNLLAQFYPSGKSTLTFLGSYIDLLGFIPSSLNSDDFMENPRQAAFTWGQTRGFEDYNRGLLGLNYNQIINDRWDISASVFTSIRDAFELRPFNVLQEDSKAIGLRFKSNYLLSPDSDRLQLILGGEQFWENYQWQTLETIDRSAGDLLSDNEEQRNYYNLFSELNWNITHQLQLNLGVNLNRTRYEYTDLFLSNGDESGTYSFENQWSPRLAASYQFDSLKSVYLEVSHGFSPPTLSETLTPDGTINPDIQPERGYNFEVGTRGTNQNGSLWWDLSIYLMDINDLLVARRIGDDQFIGINAGQTQHLGLELSLNYQLTSEAGQHNFWTNYSRSEFEFKEFVDEGADFSGNELTGTPKNKLNVGYDFEHVKGWFGNLNLLAVSAMPLRDDNSVFSEPYAVTNLRFGYQKFLGSWHLKLWGSIQNLWDERYASMLLINAGSFGGNAPRYFYPGLPRNFFTGLTLTRKFP